MFNHEIKSHKNFCIFSRIHSVWVFVLFLNVHDFVLKLKFEISDLHYVDISSSDPLTIL